MPTKTSWKATSDSFSNVFHAFRHVVNMETAGETDKLQNNIKLSEATNEATDWRTFCARDCFFPFPTIDTED